MKPENNSPSPTPQPPLPESAQAHTPKKEDPGQILGILSLVSIPLGFSLVGIILAYIGKKKSKEAGFDGSLSNIGLITCAITTILGLIAFILFIAAFGIFGAFFFDIIQKCQELGPGKHVINGTTYTCGEN